MLTRADPDVLVLGDVPPAQQPWLGRIIPNCPLTAIQPWVPRPSVDLTAGNDLWKEDHDSQDPGYHIYQTHSQEARTHEFDIASVNTVLGTLRLYTCHYH